MKNAKDVNFNVPRKSEVATLLKQTHNEPTIRFPLLTLEKPYRSDASVFKMPTGPLPPLKG
jgi:hypothetical protein